MKINLFNSSGSVFLFLVVPNLSKNTLNVQENFNKDKVTIAIFIDIEGAFDAIWQKGLLIKLHCDGIYGNILKLIDNILTNRKATCKVDTIQEEFNCSDTGAC